MSEYTVDQILQAKRVAREAGYDVKLPEDRIEQAKNIAKAHGYDVRKDNLQNPQRPNVNRADISKALEVVTNAGLSVRKAQVPGNNGVDDNINNNINRNRQIQQNQQNQSPQPPKPAQQQQQTPPAQEKPAEPQYSWAERIASRYL